jgi:hypothetical protein
MEYSQKQVSKCWLTETVKTETMAYYTITHHTIPYHKQELKIFYKTCPKIHYFLLYWFLFSTYLDTTCYTICPWSFKGLFFAQKLTKYCHHALATFEYWHLSSYMKMLYTRVCAFIHTHFFTEREIEKLYWNDSVRNVTIQYNTIQNVYTFSYPCYDKKLHVTTVLVQCSLTIALSHLSSTFYILSTDCRLVNNTPAPWLNLGGQLSQLVLFFSSVFIFVWTDRSNSKDGIPIITLVCNNS